MKYKVIKSVAHNFGHSFISLMNWRGEDYVMAHLARAAVRSGVDTLRVDLLSGAAEPDALLSRPVRASVEAYVRGLPRDLESQGVTPAAVVGGEMCVRFDLAQRAEDRTWARHFRVPVECVVRLTDDRGKTSEGRVTESWLVSYDWPPPSTTVL